MDVADFRETMSEFDCRLGNILNYSFQECSNCDAAFKVHVVLCINVEDFYVPISASPMFCCLCVRKTVILLLP